MKPQGAVRLHPVSDYYSNGQRCQWVLLALLSFPLWTTVGKAKRFNYVVILWTNPLCVLSWPCRLGLEYLIFLLPFPSLVLIFYKLCLVVQNKLHTATQQQKKHLCHHPHTQFVFDISIEGQTLPHWIIVCFNSIKTRVDVRTLCRNLISIIKISQSKSICLS